MNDYWLFCLKILAELDMVVACKINGLVSDTVLVSDTYSHLYLYSYEIPWVLLLGSVK